MLRGKDARDIEALKRLGLSTQAISELPSCDRKTIRTCGAANLDFDWPRIARQWLKESAKKKLTIAQKLLDSIGKMALP